MAEIVIRIGVDGAERPDHFFAALNVVRNTVHQVLEEVKAMSGSVNDLKAKLAAMESIGDKMAELLTSLSQQLKAQQGDPAALASLAADADTHSTAWQQAVSAATDAANASGGGTPTPTPPTGGTPTPTPTPPADGSSGSGPSSIPPTGTETPL